MDCDLAMKTKIALVFLGIAVVSILFVKLSRGSNATEWLSSVKGYSAAQESCHSQFERFCREDVGYKLPEVFRVYFDKTEMPDDVIRRVPVEQHPFDSRDSYRFVVTGPNNQLWLIEKGQPPHLIQ